MRLTHPEFGFKVALIVPVMKIAVIGLLFQFFGSFAAQAAPSCAGLISQAAVAGGGRVIFDSGRIEIRDGGLSDHSSLLRLREKPLTSDPAEATMEILSMLVQNSSYSLTDKNILHKDAIQLGIPADNHYSFNLRYESDGRFDSRFNLRQIEIISPTGQATKIVKEVLVPSALQIKDADVEIPKDVYPGGKSIELKVPLTLEGKAIEELDRMTPTLELFSKKELREIVASKSYRQMKMNLLIKKTKALFRKYLIAAPFKSVTNLIPSLILATAISFTIPMVKQELSLFHHEAAKSPTVSVINEVPASTVKPEIRDQFDQIRMEAEQRLLRDSAQTPRQAPGVQVQLSDRHMTWIFQQKDAKTGQVRTYAVFSEETVKGDESKPIKYVTVEIDPVKHADLIKFLRTQGRVLN